MEPLPRRRKEGGGEIVEVYGFAGWIASFVAYAIYLVWAFVPESMLHAVGVTYYPSKYVVTISRLGINRVWLPIPIVVRYWAIAIPCAIFVTSASVVLAYIAVNFLSTAPLDSFDTITDMHARPMVDRESFLEDEGTTDSASRVPDIGDMDLMTVNRVLYQVEESYTTFGDGALCSSRVYFVYCLKFQLVWVQQLLKHHKQAETCPC